MLAAKPKTGGEFMSTNSNQTSPLLTSPEDRLSFVLPMLWILCPLYDVRLALLGVIVGLTFLAMVIGMMLVSAPVSILKLAIVL